LREVLLAPRRQDDTAMAPCRLHWSVGDVEVFHVDLSDYADIEDAAVGWLSAEWARRERFVHSPARRQFMICRAYVRLLLTQRLGCHRSELDFSLGQFGKPSALVRGGVTPVEFNVSHGGSHGLIAQSTATPIGIDLEEKRPGLAFLDISESVFSDEERALLREYSAEWAMRLFYRIGRPVEIHAYADLIVIRQDGRIVAEHERSFGGGKILYDPWHYVPVLARKPGALRNGAPFRDWVLPGALERIRRRLAGSMTATGRWSRFSPPC
jgi:hypothetical protein